jgi:hypothetical protein
VATGAFMECMSSDSHAFTPLELAPSLVLLRSLLRGLTVDAALVEDLGNLSGEFLTQGDLDFLETVCSEIGGCPHGDDYFPLRLTVLTHRLRHRAPWPEEERLQYAYYWLVEGLDRHGAAVSALPAGFFDAPIEEAAVELWSAVVVALAEAALSPVPAGPVGPG